MRNDTGLRIHGHIGHLHATHAGTGQPVLNGPSPLIFQPIGPSNAVACFQVQTFSSFARMMPSFGRERSGIDLVLLGDQVKDLPEGVLGRPAMGTRDATRP
jgi:hypothetical protein